MLKDQKILIIFLVVTLILAAILTLYILHKKDNQVKEETAALFSNPVGEAPYTDLLGNPVELEQYLGKTLVVATWASWSPFSRDDLMGLNELAQNFNSEQVVFLAINRKETREQAGRYVNTLPELNNLIFVLDPRDHFYNAVGGYAMPELVVYNEKGEVIEHYRGVVPIGDLKTLLENLN